MNAQEPAIDTTVPHSARVWNYWLGGEDNYPVDREAGDQFLAVFPGIATLARSSRAFQERAVRHLAGEQGIRQFLDVGAGLPTVDNTHEVAQSVAPDARVVYVDHDPLVITHGRSLLTSTAEGRAEYVHADLYEPEVILERAGELLDLDRPVALMLLGVLGHVQKYDDAVSIVRSLLAGLPRGSFLTLSEGSNVHSEESVEAQDEYNESGAIPYITRTPQEIGRYLEGLELIEPGFVSVPRWRPEASGDGLPAELDQYGGVGRKA